MFSFLTLLQLTPSGQMDFFQQDTCQKRHQVPEKTGELKLLIMTQMANQSMKATARHWKRRSICKMASLLTDHHSDSISNLDLMLNFTKAWLSFWWREVGGRVQAICWMQEIQIFKQLIHIMLLLLCALQSARLCTSWLISWDSLLGLQLWDHLFAKVSLWAQFHWAMLELCKTDLSALSPIIKRSQSYQKCYWHLRASLLSACKGLQLNYIGLQMLTNMVLLESKLHGPEKHTEGIVWYLRPSFMT